MAVETYANDYETSLNGAVTASRPTTLTFRDAIPSTLSGGNFRVRVEAEYLLVPAGGVSGLICTGCTTVEGSTASSHPDRAVVDQVLTRQGMLNSPGPMTTKGDIIYADTGGEPKRLPLGTTNQVLTADASGIPAWAAAAGGGGGSSTPLVNPYTARMYRTAAYTLTGGSVWTKFPFDTVDFDGDSDLVIASNRYVARVAGKYQVNAEVDFTTAFAVQVALAVYVNGTQRALIDNANSAFHVHGSAEVSLAVGDYVEIFYLAAGTPACYVTTPSNQNYMDIALIPGTIALPANTLVAKMYRSAAYTTAAATETKMPFDTVDFDPNGNVTIGSSQYTVPVSGKYLVDFQLYLNVSDRQIPHIRVNNVMKAKGEDLGGNGSQCVAILDLVAGDVVTAFYYTTGADAIVTGQNPAINRMEITFLAGTGATIWVPQGPVIIPGFAGSPDIKAGGASDDEFEQNTAGTPSGWTAFNTPGTVDTNTVKSHLHLKETTNGGAHTHKGILKAAPSIPYTLTAKISDGYVGGPWATFGRLGIFVLDGTTTGKMLGIELLDNRTWEVAKWTDWTTYSAASFAAALLGATVPLYIRFKVNSATNIDVLASLNGQTWFTLVAAVNFLVNATYVGLALDPHSQTVEATFDWIRFS